MIKKHSINWVLFSLVDVVFQYLLIDLIITFIKKLYNNPYSELIY